jgi:hypothetical protein
VWSDPRAAARAGDPAPAAAASVLSTSGSGDPGRARAGAAAERLGWSVGASGDAVALAPAAGQAALDISAPTSGTPTARSSGSGARCSARTREPELGLQTGCRRTARSWHLRLGDLGANDPHRHGLVGFRNSSGRGSATVGSFVESGEGGSFAVVVCVPGGAGSARARFAVGAFAPVEGAGDLGVAARVGCSPTSVGSAEAVAGGSCFSGCVEPLVAARSVGLLLGEAGDVVGQAAALSAS